MGIMESKKEVRKIIKERRAFLTEEKRKNLDKLIFEKVIASKEYKDAECIFIFVSYDSEVDTHNIIKQAIKDGKKLCVPKVISLEEGMIIVQIKSFEDLESGAYGILEPKDNTLKIDESLIDVSYLPGLAFDRKGGRVGYGGGFYDRFIGKTREDSKKIGIGYSFQILEEVPMDAHDKFIDGIITD